MSEARRTSKVFLSYASEDRATAQLLALRLQDVGVSVSSESIISPGENFIDAITGGIRACDYVVLLVSAAALHSRSVQMEIASATSLQELRDRSITVIPILLDDVQLPEALREIVYLDFRNDPRAAMEELVSRLSSTVSIDFSHLNGRQFENLIGDLLTDLGLQVEREVLLNGTSFDFRALFQTHDPFGAPCEETWFVEAKHYSSGRLSVSVIAELTARTLANQGSATRFALITSSQITSAAREMLHRSHLRIIEGVELKRILLTRPHLIERYFGARSL